MLPKTIVMIMFLLQQKYSELKKYGEVDFGNSVQFCDYFKF